MGETTALRTEDNRERTCAERVAGQWESRKEDFRAILDAECAGLEPGDEGWPEQYGPFNEYGLWFDYVAPDTFDDQPEAFFRYGLSTGGPGDELRFYHDAGATYCYRIEYWFLDWFDGAMLDVTHDEVARGVWQQFEDFAEDYRDEED